ncbi:YwmB family TATA-box binding protein [Pelosinus sp. sgz500959]|uniref:YwmB family TATA-box binding protein n=1 Tax=Pelosinus sp. sgz500959 TaxID=3242472 RepID=UPI003670EC17
MVKFKAFAWTKVWRKQSFLYKMIIAIVCSFIFLLAPVKHVPAASSYEPLHAAMLATGAKVEEWSIHAWVKLPNEQLNDDQLEDIVHEVMKELGINTLQYQVTHQQGKKHHIVQAEMIDPMVHVLAVAQILSSGSLAGGSEGYLVINIEAKDDENISVKHIQEKIASITKKNGHSPQINTCLIGWLDGKLRDGEWRHSLQNAIEITHAKNIDQLETEDFASYTGFTPEIAEYLQIGDKRINLNIAMHYSQYDHRTYVTIGSPMITREY